jgi:hypothetical protein
MRIGLRVAFAFILCSSLVAFVPAKAGDAMKDEQVGKYFLFAGLNTRIDSIETVAKADGNPIISNIGDWGAYAHSDTQGYLLVHMTSQNPSSSEDRGVSAGNCTYYIGYELEDGSQRNTDRGPDRVVMGKNNIEVQDGLQLHPKETKEFTSVLLAWDGSPVTKLFMKVNDGCTGYPAYGVGAQYVRIPIHDKDIKSIPVTPGDIPT